MTDDNSLDAFCESLKSLRPARQTLDARQVFYSAGVAAAQKGDQRLPHDATIRFLAAMFVGIVVTAPLAYRLGQSGAPTLQDGVAEQSIPTGSESSVASAPTNTKSVEEHLANAQLLANDQRLPNDQQLANDGDSSVGPAKRSRDKSQSVGRSQLASAFASWLDLSERVAAVQLDRATQSTLSAFHGSLVRDSTYDLIDFPIPMIEDSFVLGSSARIPEDADLGVRPLAVGDRQWVVSNLEESR